MVTTVTRKSRRDLEPRRARRLSGETLTIRVWETDTGAMYFAIPRRLGTAVERNRMRRQLRELARRWSVRPGVASVISVESLPADFHKLEEEFRQLLSRLGVLSE